jgi:hypothetical protein
MSGRGLHLALTDQELSNLRKQSAEHQADYIGEALEAVKFDTDDACETDKSWAYIHSALNGTDPDGPLAMGAQPKQVFLSGIFGRTQQISDGRYAIMGDSAVLDSEDYYIGLIASDRVPTVWTALAAISTDELGRLVKEVHRKFAASGSAADAADYAMSWFPALVQFYSGAADTRKHVIFTVDF